MSKLIKQFDELMSHLNGEENDLALTFKARLALFVVKANRDAEWRSCLEGGGVDNWDGYGDCFPDEDDEEDE